MDNEEKLQVVNNNRTEIIKNVKEVFEKKYRHIEMNSLDDNIIIEFWKKPHILNSNSGFDARCDHLYDYLISNDLVYIQE